MKSSIPVLMAVAAASFFRIGIGRTTPPTTEPSSSAKMNYVERSLDDARALTPDAAKAVMVARAAKVDLHSPGTRRASGPIVHFEVTQATDGWYVYCYGGTAGNGSSVHIDRSWTPGEVFFGPPPRPSKTDSNR